jgi:transposase
MGQHQADAQPRERPFLQRLPLPPPHLVERFFSKLEHFRAVATRREKHDANNLTLVKLAAIRKWFRSVSR